MRRFATFVSALAVILALFGFSFVGTASAHSSLHDTVSIPYLSSGMSSPIIFRILNNKSNLCIGIAPGQNYAGDWSCNYHNDQLWHWGNCNPNAYSYCQLINNVLINNKPQCLGVDGASTAAGARILAWSCNNNNDQWWVYGPNGPTFTNFNSRLVIGVLNGSTQNGAELIQWGANNNPDQNWSFL